jgi:hypothetical protein
MEFDIEKFSWNFVDTFQFWLKSDNSDGYCALHEEPRAFLPASGAKLAKYLLEPKYLEQSCR